LVVSFSEIVVVVVSRVVRTVCARLAGAVTVACQLKPARTGATHLDTSHPVGARLSNPDRSPP